MDGDKAHKIFVLKNNREISQDFGIPHEKVKYYVDKYGLPAFKIGGRGSWKALPEHLKRWMEEQAEKYIGKPVDEENENE
jgi:hypothetical protein